MDGENFFFPLGERNKVYIGDAQFVENGFDGRKLSFTAVDDDADIGRFLHGQRTLGDDILGDGVLMTGLRRSGRNRRGFLVASHSFL